MQDLLFLAHRIPYPPNKGDKIRAWHLLRHLAQRYRVHLAFLVDDPDDEQFVPALAEICASVSWRPLVPLRAKLRSLLGLLTGAPLTLGYFRDRGLQQAIDRVIREHPPEQFFVFSSAMAPYVERHRAARYVLDLVDVDSVKWRDYAATASGPARLLYRREARALLALERRTAAQADEVLLVSEAEADLFRALAPETAPRVRHICNGVDTDYFDPALTFADPFGDAPALVFTGAMDYRPNVEAVVWFAGHVMPRLRLLAQAPEFWIVGAHPSPAVLALTDADIHVTGRVADVRPYLRHAAAVVAPLRTARGIQNKVLEAMAMAAAVVVTPQAREGLAACGNDVLIETDSAEGFASALQSILTVGAGDIGSRARACVRHHYGWEASFAELDTLMKSEHRAPRGAFPDPTAPCLDPSPIAAE